MILVINLNASVDKRYSMKDLEKGSVMRAESVENTPGGKGLHVANVANIMGEEVLATGFLGGKSGEFIADALVDYGIRNDFVKIAGETRSCLAIITEDGAQTEILEPGPLVSPEELEEFHRKYRELLPKADVVVASGSVPRGVPETFYGELIHRAKTEGKRFLLDTSGKLLAKGLEAGPYFIKPNRDEIEALRGCRVENEEDVIKEICSFLEEGVDMAVVSLGAEGALAGFEGSIYRITVPVIQAKNPVGSGDSFVAGIAVGLARSLPVTECLRLAAACGTANAMEEESGFVRQQTVEELLSRIRVEKVLGR